MALMCPRTLRIRGLSKFITSVPPGHSESEGTLKIYYICYSIPGHHSKDSRFNFRTPRIRRYARGGGGYSVYAGIRICACLLGCIFMKFGISMGGFPSLTQCTQFAKLGVFFEILPKKHPIWPKLGVFLLKMVY